MVTRVRMNTKYIHKIWWIWASHSQHVALQIFYKKKSMLCASVLKSVLLVSAAPLFFPILQHKSFNDLKQQYSNLYNPFTEYLCPKIKCSNFQMFLVVFNYPAAIFFLYSLTLACRHKLDEPEIPILNHKLHL